MVNAPRSSPSRAARPRRVTAWSSSVSSSRGPSWSRRSATSVEPGEAQPGRCLVVGQPLGDGPAPLGLEGAVARAAHQRRRAGDEALAAGGVEVGRPLADERGRAGRHPRRLVGVRLPVEPRHQLEDAEPVAPGAVGAGLEHDAVEVGREGLAPLAVALGHAARALGRRPGPGPAAAFELADAGGHQVVERRVVDEARFEAQAGRRPAARRAWAHRAATRPGHRW